MSSTTRTTTRITLAERPTGSVTDANFATVTTDLPPLADGEFLVDVAYLSIDPTIRGWMQYDTYLPKIPISETIRSGGVGEVVESRNDRFAVGTRVSGMTGWQSRAVLTRALRLPDAIEYTDALSLLGMTGLTAYVGLIDIGKPEQGQTVVVSGAAGAVGSVAGQIARILGCRVVGVAGGPDKCAMVTDEFGFDECVDHHAGSVAAQLRRACPEGIDVYFDNVGGETLNAVLGQIRDHARIVLCGAISGYDTATAPPGPANLPNAISRRATLRGFIVLDHADRAKEAVDQLASWRAEGLLQARVDVTEGLGNAPEALMGLFSGKNVGKSLVHVTH